MACIGDIRERFRYCPESGNGGVWENIFIEVNVSHEKSRANSDIRIIQLASEVFILARVYHVIKYSSRPRKSHG